MHYIAGIKQIRDEDGRIFGLLEDLAGFPRRKKDNSERHRMGRDITEDDINFKSLRKLHEFGYIQLGIASPVTMSITRLGEEVYKQNRDIRLMKSDKLYDRIRGYINQLPKRLGNWFADLCGLLRD